jgi:hypothetical protein
MIMQLANRRVGMSEMTSPTQMPNRTPGITALSMLQQVNRRFTPAFNDMRLCISGALRQCLYRYQERLLSGNNGVFDHFTSVVGPQSALALDSLLRNENFDEWFDVELTASSVSVNREADRQDAIMLVNTLGQYYKGLLELTLFASNPQAPPEAREVARKISIASSEIMDRALRTFDQVRDPATFTVSIEEDINRAAAEAPQRLMQQIAGSLGGALLGGGGQEQPQLPERTEE